MPFDTPPCSESTEMSARLIAPMISGSTATTMISSTRVKPSSEYIERS